MRKLTHRLAAKIAAIFLLAILAAVAGASVLGIAYAYSANLYEYDYASFFDTDLCRDRTSSLGSSLIRNYEEIGATTDFDNLFAAEQNNCRFTLYREGEEDKPLYETEQPETVGFELTVSLDGYTARCSVAAPITAHDGYYDEYRLFNLVNPLRHILIVLLAASIFLGVADFIFLCCAAGHRGETEEVFLNRQDRIPLDLYFTAAGLLIFACLNITFSVGNYFGSGLEYISGFLLILIAGLILLSALLTFATRVKVGRWWENTVLYHLLRLGLRILKAAGRGLQSAFRVLPLIPRAILIVGAAMLLEILLTAGLCSGGGAFVGLLWFSYNILLFGLLCFGALQMKRLRTAGEKLAGGQMEYKLDTSKMYWEFKKHGDCLNAIGDGMSAAVDQRMKSERLKTELITNVSHDIKTPLTSLINYVDLLQKEHTAEQAAEYIEVLSRQSQRLKKLTEDLLEASKASTGNLSVTLTNTNLGELLRQTLGEYSERISLAGLETVLSVPEEPVTVLADGRLLWRVMDNLLANICKYAMSGTRVYIDVLKKPDAVCVLIKNISRDKLNISGDELTERFVRGDLSRNTEGSGLGLHIARSLVELQRGSFRLEVDGDLFKTELRLKL
jgi:signal transduction histidine kinase